MEKSSHDESQDKASTLPPDTIAFAHRMFDAAREGDTTLLLSAVDAGLSPNLTNSKGNSLLMLAAYAGHTELTKGLLERGGDPNRINDLGQSMIAGAVFKGHIEVVHALSAKGADPRLGTPNAIQAAHMFGRHDLFKEFGGTEEDKTNVPNPLPPS
ncbi:ankyrin repeat-containing domain protein [Crepidotus variabilis]|uniref:Ankyrin repeat-containing domain protein n=1 Tax=Crepidotus variabilis TaxID=179855 RepID=A0A9P6EAB6_9AGAR|nr:ankyrin repeat-containing domain protein [Crepidotus variabilis]